MTIKQLTYLIEIQNTGSFTAASKKLGVSQGVISQSIKDLESELGFKVFERTSKKLDITKRGFLTLTEAKKILNTCKDILSIKKIDTPDSLKIRTFDFSPIIDTFNGFVKKYEHTKNTHLSLKISEYNDVINGVLENKCDLGVMIFPSQSKHGVSKFLDGKLFNVVSLATQPLCIKLRKNHPALISNNPLTELKNYKFVHFRNESFYPNSSMEKMFIDFNNTVYLNDKVARYKLVSTTDAYMIGIRQLDEYKKAYDLHEIPLRNSSVEIVCFYRKNAELSEYMADFIDSLCDKFRLLFNS